MVASIDGKRLIRMELRSERTLARQTGLKLAEAVLEAGGR